jgi:hypothetical protein
MKFDVEASSWVDMRTRAPAPARRAQKVTVTPRDQVLAVALRAMAHGAGAYEAQARTLQFYRRGRGAWLRGLSGGSE